MKFDLEKKANLKQFFHFYILNSDISFIIVITVIKCYTDVKNIHMKGTTSQICCLGLSFYFI